MMIISTMKLFSPLSCWVVVTMLVASALATPVARRHNDLPNLSDALSVAKSPFEPVTLAPSNANFRNDGLPSTESPFDLPKPERLTTRDVSSLPPDEQDKETTATTEMDETTTLPTTEATTSKPEISTVASTDVTETTTNTDFELDSTTKTPTDDAIDLQRIPATTTTTTTAAPSPAEPSTERSIEVDKPVTTAAPSEETTLSSSSAPTSPPTTERPSTEASPEPESEPEVTTNPPKVQSDDATPVVATTTTTEAPATTKTSAPEVPSSSTTQAPVETEASSTQAPTSPPTEAPSSTAPPTTTTTTTTTATPIPSSSTTEAPSVSTEKNDDSSRSEKVDDKASCNHLPTYESEELQKVFREEVTYKNGTIKGKFTYVNFDQRYRLVYYTRLPYGPVKIDLVEELGRPENATTNQQAPNLANEVPNAVLQLRNILPNSLFGFPFVGPNSASNGRSGLEQDRRENSDDKSNTYFYHTDSISTPNLLSSTVPVSLLPGQRRANQPVSQLQVDTLSQSYNENLQVGNNGALQNPSGLKQKQRANSPAAPLLDISNQNRNIPYSMGPQAPPVPAEQPKQPGLVYTGWSHAAPPPPPPQYQYSPVPTLYTFNQPTYYSTSSKQSLQPPQSGHYNFKVKQSENLEQSDLVPPPSNHHHHHQTHQPHSHEHYVAPFMFSQPSALHNEQPEGGRLKLKVKTSKSLSMNHQDAQGGQKSAQLRAPVSYQFPGSIRSPVQIHRSEHLQPQQQQSQQQQQQQFQHRHRSGKQNYELKQTVNTSPVVYHVLRSPVGKVYSLPQYQQTHAMAYDHDQ